MASAPQRHSDHARHQVYVNTQANRLLCKLPAEAVAGLRYYEIVGVKSMMGFRPYPPLLGQALPGQKYYFMAVTDWSLFVLSLDSNYLGSVLVEIPLLGIKEIESEEADSNLHIEQGDDYAKKAFKTSLITIYPKVDISRLDPKQRAELDVAVRDANALSGGTAVRLPAGQRMFAGRVLPVGNPPPLAVPPTGTRYTSGHAEAFHSGAEGRPGHLLHSRSFNQGYAHMGHVIGRQAERFGPWVQTNVMRRRGRMASDFTGSGFGRALGEAVEVEGGGNHGYPTGAATTTMTAAQPPAASLQQQAAWADWQSKMAAGPSPQGGPRPGMALPVQPLSPQQQQQAAVRHAVYGAPTLSSVRLPPPAGLTWVEEQSHAWQVEQQGRNNGSSALPVCHSPQQQQQQYHIQKQQQQTLQRQGQQQQQPQWFPAGAQPRQAVPQVAASGYTPSQLADYDLRQRGQKLGTFNDPASAPYVSCPPEPQHGPGGGPFWMPEARHRWDPEHQARYGEQGYGGGGGGEGGPGAGAGLTWVEEQSLAWQSKQARQRAAAALQQQGPRMGALASWQAGGAAAAAAAAQQTQALPGPPPYVMQHQAASWPHTHQSVQQQQQEQQQHAGQQQQEHQRYPRQQQQQQEQWPTAGGAPPPLPVPQAQHVGGVDAVPPHLRPPLPLAVPQPGRDEVWRADDEDAQALTHEDMLDLLPGYALEMLTIEPRSSLAFHLRRAWLGAHMRLGLAAAGRPGLLQWYIPPASPFLIQSSATALLRACPDIASAVEKQGGRLSLSIPHEEPLQRMQLLAYFGTRVLVLPAQQHQRWALGTGPSGLWHLYPGPELSPQLHQWPQYPGMDTTPQAWHRGALHAAANLGDAVGAQQAQQQQQPGGGGMPTTAAAWALQQDWQHNAAQAFVTSGHTRWRPGGLLRGPQGGDSISAAGATAAVCAASAGEGEAVEAEHPRDVWRGWEEGRLSAGCSLFDDDDCELMREMMLEAGLSDPARAHDMAARFFGSPVALRFTLHRLYAWGALCALYGTPSQKPKVPSGPGVSEYVAYVLGKNKRPGVDQEVDTLAGTVKTVDEEAYDFFKCLYEVSTWMGPPGGARGALSTARPKTLLARLGLASSSEPSLAATTDTIVDTIRRLAAMAGEGDGRGGWRSEPPRVPAPPTLAPEPLCLSPMQELPYLFALSIPSAAHRFSAPDDSQQPAWKQESAYKQARTYEAQSALQRTSFGRDMQSSYMDNYLGAQATDAVHEAPTHGAQLWESLMGRLVARVAWKRVTLLLHWLNSSMAFGEGASTQLRWLGDGVVEHGKGAKRAWTHEDCTRHLVAVMTQLRDPEGPLSLLSMLQPQSRADMLSWSRAEAGNSALDWQANILYEIAGISRAGDCVRAGATRTLFVRVLKDLPREASHHFARRLFLRITCLLTGSATLHGISAADKPTDAAFAAADRGQMITIVSAYSPTEAASDEEAGDFYLRVAALADKANDKRDLLIVAGGSQRRAWDSSQLRRPAVRREFNLQLSDRFGLLEAVPPEGADAQAEYDAMAAAIREVATNHLAPRGSRRRRGWQFTLSQRTLRLMDARQRAHTAWLRSKSAAAKRERNRANRAADAAVQRDRERWIGQQVAEAQDMLRKKNLRQFARACDRLAGRSRSHQIPPAMRDVSGALHSGPDGVLKAMTESFDKLYGGETKLSDETLNQLENDVAAFELTRATEVDEAHGRPPDLAETEACVRALRSAAAPGGTRQSASWQLGSPHTLVAETNALRMADVLVTMLDQVPGVAHAIGSLYSEQLLHLLRTPSARAALSARSCNEVLARATLDMLDSIILMVRGVDEVLMPARAGSSTAYGAGGVLSVSHVASRSALHSYRMPTALT
ncbi:hypothetical protein FOA52_004106 [Chlamydomonas sp. UWO 241]|nr:hypothetical protein FOA52_004106 [Chlamydomonas sp. UWO 241]